MRALASLAVVAILAGAARADEPTPTPTATPVGRWAGGEPAWLRCTGFAPGASLRVSLVSGAESRPARVCWRRAAPDGSTLLTCLVPAAAAGPATVEVADGATVARAPMDLLAPGPAGMLAVATDALADGNLTVTVTVVAGLAPGKGAAAGPVECFYLPLGNAPLEAGLGAITLPADAAGGWTGTVPACPGATGLVARGPEGGCSGTIPLPTDGGPPATDPASPADDLTPASDPVPDPGVTTDTAGGPLIFAGNTALDREWTLAAWLGLRGRLGRDLLGKGDRLELGTRLGYAVIDVPTDRAVQQEFTIVTGNEPFTLTGTGGSQTVERLSLFTLLGEVVYRAPLGSGGLAPYACAGLGLVQLTGDTGRGSGAARFGAGLEVALTPVLAATFEVADLIFRARVIDDGLIHAVSVTVGLRYRF